MEKRHRIFIAINLPADIKKVLDRYQAKYPELPAKWMSQSNMHITLEFLGDLTDQEIGDTCRIAKEVAQKHSAFSINLNSVSYGPKNKMPPKMIWVNGEKSKELAELKNDLQNSLLESVRFAPDVQSLPAGRQEFTPHITLARISEWQFRSIEPEEVPEINEGLDLMFTVESIEVMESINKRGGPVYETLESCPLNI